MDEVGQDGWIQPRKKEGHCTYCTTVRTTLSNVLYTVHIVHVPCFPVSDVEVSPSTSVRALVHIYKCSLTHFSVSLAHFT